MTCALRIILAQIDCRVGDITGNLKKIQLSIAKAVEQQAHLICFPELAITGYPPEDLLARDDFIAQARAALQAVAMLSKDIVIVVGHPRRTKLGLFNAASWCEGGSVKATYYKQYLPNYGLFDEKRYFTTGEKTVIRTLNGIPIAICICEDIWHPKPAADAVALGAQMILNLNASPFRRDKAERRAEVLKERALENKVPIVYVHMVGGQDELVFDGGSMVINNMGELTHHASFFEEQLLLCNCLYVNNEVIPEKTFFPPLPSLSQRVYSALTLGIRDYVQKNGFKAVIVGSSGGIDSALTLCLAVDALGPQNVTSVLLPSRYTSSESNELATTLAQNLGIKSITINIEEPFQAFLSVLAPHFTNYPEDITEQNIQARTRAICLMALANKYNQLVLNTGNKSELAVGYTTLYGDMAGAFAVLKDVYKTQVYELARFRNQQHCVIPEGIFQRAPSAELAPDQHDQQTLPPYSVLDQILERFIEGDQTYEEIVKAGYEAKTTAWVIRAVARNEHKRRQGPLGVRVSSRAFGRDRRYPITSNFDFMLEPALLMTGIS